MTHTENEKALADLIVARREWDARNALDPEDYRFDMWDRQTMMCECCGTRHAIVGTCRPLRNTLS